MRMKILLSRKMDIEKRGSAEERYENYAVSEIDKYKKNMKDGSNSEKTAFKKCRRIFIEDWKKSIAELSGEEKTASAKALRLYKRKTIFVK